MVELGHKEEWGNDRRLAPPVPPIIFGFISALSRKIDRNNPKDPRSFAPIPVVEASLRKSTHALKGFTNQDDQIKPT